MWDSLSSTAICATARSGPWGFIRAAGRDPGHELASAPSAAICARTLKKMKQSRSLRSLSLQARNVPNWKNQLDKFLKIESHWQNVIEVETCSFYRRNCYRRS
jgi:hypothetical protein